MQVIIFSSIKNKRLLQQILNWGGNSHIKFQMYFSMRNFKNILKQKHDFIICTEKSHAAVLKEGGYKAFLVEDNWYKGIRKIHEV